jgi:thioredoxin reductase (NADPH)
VSGNPVVKEVALKNVKTAELSTLATDGFFVFIGHTPNTELFKGQLTLDQRGYIVIDGQMQASLPGVYAAGEAADSQYRQVVTSAGMGAAAAIQLTHYLEDHKA